DEQVRSFFHRIPQPRLAPRFALSVAEQFSCQERDRRPPASPTCAGTRPSTLPFQPNSRWNTTLHPSVPAHIVLNMTLLSSVPAQPALEHSPPPLRSSAPRPPPRFVLSRYNTKRLHSYRSSL